MIIKLKGRINNGRIRLKGVIQGETTTMKTRQLEICDDCSLVPYDKGIGVVREWDYEDDLDAFDAAEVAGRAAQVKYMVELGAIIEDHDCSTQTAPEIGLRCDCACNNR